MFNNTHITSGAGDNMQTLDTRIKGTYHITDVSNLASILHQGLQSHAEAYKCGLVKKDISEPTVNARRGKFRFSDGRSLHDYAVLYFNPLNPMLYMRKAMQKRLVILEFSTEIFRHHGIKVTDGNAADGATQVLEPAQLDLVDFDTVFAPYWTDRTDGKRKRCAEVLYPSVLPSAFITAICVASVELAKWICDHIEPRFHSLVQVRQEVFFS